MNRTQLSLTAAVIAVLLAGGSFYLGRASSSHGAPTASAPAASAPGERKVLYWHDPMVPGQRFDKPGKSPYMEMQLVPVYADEGGDAGIKVSPTVQQNLGLRTVAVKRMEVSSSFDAVGTVQFDERLAVAVQSRVAGYVERLSVRAPMERVRKGQALATVFAPDWLGPLNELAALKRAGVSEDLVAAARDRTTAMSIPAALVRQAEDGGAINARFTLTAPASGVVAELGVRDGAMVSPGMTLFRIAGLETVWAVAEVPEAQAVHLVRGQHVKAVLQADATRAFEGRLAEVLPQVNASTRTLQARFEVANAGGKLNPGMLLRLQVAGPKATRLVVPSEAVIRTGMRAVAIVRKADGRFEPREIQLGRDFGDLLEVAQGLSEGDEVVASGQFLVDSEARLRSVLGSMAAGQPASAPVAAITTFSAQGKVERVDADSVTLTHGPVPELKWPGMTMGFGKADPKAFPDLKPGDSVHFEFKKGGPMDYELVSVHRTGGAK